jgi:hypothetical protein
VRSLHHGPPSKELDEAVKAIGSNVTGLRGDVAKLADLDRLYETVGKVKGRIDIIFANAGVAEFLNDGGSMFRAHLDDRSQRSSYPIKCYQPRSNQDAGDEPAISGRNCTHCVHRSDGTHG